MYPLKTNRDVIKLKWQYKVRSMPKKRLPAIVDKSCMGERNNRTEYGGIAWLKKYGRIQGETKKR